MIDSRGPFATAEAIEGPGGSCSMHGGAASVR